VAPNVWHIQCLATYSLHGYAEIGLAQHFIFCVIRVAVVCPLKKGEREIEPGTLDCKPSTVSTKIGIRWTNVVQRILPCQDSPGSPLTKQAHLKWVTGAVTASSHMQDELKHEKDIFTALGNRVRLYSELDSDTEWLLSHQLTIAIESCQNCVDNN